MEVVASTSVKSPKSAVVMNVISFGSADSKAKVANVRRNLFGKCSDDQVAFAKEILQNAATQFASRWGFDVLRDEPLVNSNFEWERYKTPNDDIPEVYHCQSSNRIRSFPLPQSERLQPSSPAAEAEPEMEIRLPGLTRVADKENVIEVDSRSDALESVPSIATTQPIRRTARKTKKTITDYMTKTKWNRYGRLQAKLGYPERPATPTPPHTSSPTPL